MIPDASKNFAKAQLAAGYASGVTSIVLVGGGGAKFPTPPFNAVWWNVTDYLDPADDPSVEVVRVTGIATDTLGITRGQEGTSAANHNTAGKSYMLVAGPTAKITTDLAPYVGKLWIHADPNFATGTSYERVNYPLGLGVGFVQIVPHRVFDVTHANALATTTTMEGWTSRNTTGLTSADSNVTLAGALHIVHNTSGTDDQFNATDTGANWYRAHDAGASGHEIIAHVKIGTTQAGWAVAIEIQDANALTYWARIGIVSGTPLVQAHGTIAGTSTALATAALTATDVNTNGVWLRVIRSGCDATFFYSIANQATPPTTWTLLDRKLGIFKSGAEQFLTSIYAYRYSGSATVGVTADVMYFDASFTPTPFASVGADAGVAAAGYDSGTALTLIASYDLGSGNAVIVDADVQSAVTEIENQRFIDTAAWTYSAVRGSSPSPVASTYQAKAAIVVGGTGRYFALYAKCTSTARIQPGSLNTAALRIPYTP